VSKEFVPRKSKVKHIPLVDPQSVLLPLTHIKMSWW